MIFKGLERMRHYSAQLSQGKLSFHHIAHEISEKAFAKAHHFRDKVNIEFLTKNGKLCVKPSKLPQVYCHLFQQNFIFDAERDISSHFAMGHGPGGSAANANKNAVILRHRPSGVLIRSSKFRSLSDNRRFALNKINIYLEYYLLGKYSRLGRVFAKQRERHLQKIQKKEERRLMKEELAKEKMTIVKYFLPEGSIKSRAQDIESSFLNENRNGTWQWLLDNGRISILPWLLPIPSANEEICPYLSMTDWDRIVRDPNSARRLRLSVQSCLEVFGLYLDCELSGEASPEDKKYKLARNSQNASLNAYIIRTRKGQDAELWCALLERLERFAHSAKGKYEAIASIRQYV